MTEEIIIHEFQSGDPLAFKRIYHRYFNDVYSVCFKYTRNTEATEELTHDAFVILWQKCNLIDPAQGVKAYLLTIARNEVFRWIKKQAANTAMREEMKLKIIQNQECIQQDLATDASIDLQRVKEFLNGFPAKRKKVFELIKFEQLSYAEVAEQLSISRDTVKDHMIKANRSLNELNLNGEFSYGCILLCFLLQG